mmetsp:Transcript_19525/g.45413  ORF Transcript_19525/g.45413 Transcript_19525/m.45413 type:complete len:524 (+) Transcript_19525:80-1651(+)
MAAGRVSVQVFYHPTSKAAAFTTETLPASLRGHLQDDAWRSGVVKIKKQCLDVFGQEPVIQPMVPCCRRAPTAADKESDIEHLSSMMQSACREITESQPPEIRWWISEDKESFGTLYVNVEVDEPAPPKCLSPDCQKAARDRCGGYCSPACQAAAIVRSASDSSRHKLLDGKKNYADSHVSFGSNAGRSTNGHAPPNGRLPSPLQSIGLDASSEAARRVAPGSPTNTASWMAPLPEPVQNASEMLDPRSSDSVVGVIGFYHPGSDDPCDTICKAPFLGNFWDLNPIGLMLEVPRHPGCKRRFGNAEAAYQALKFWDTHVVEFETATAEEAYGLKKAKRGEEDYNFAGYGSNWYGMLAVLRSKFEPGSVFAEALLNTGDCFLLEHNADVGRDAVWSDNSIGDGKNWLGMQLMLVRDELLGTTRWTDFINRAANREPLGQPKGGPEWQEAVHAASDAIVQALHKAAVANEEHDGDRVPKLKEPKELRSQEPEDPSAARRQLLSSMPACFAGFVSCASTVGNTCNK